MPVADGGTAWDGSASAQRVADWAGIDNQDAGDAEWSKYAQAFLWQDPDADPMTRGAYKLGVADVIGGRLEIVPEAVYAVAGVLNGARGGADIPSADQDRLKTVVTALYRLIAKAMDDDTIEAPFALVASGDGPFLPPRAWFDDPKLTGPTPLTISPDGRVFGHAASWDFPHIGFPGSDVFAPHSRTGYAYFTLGATMTDGGEVATGKLTVGGGHADLNGGFTAATEHYDNVGTAVATVTAGEDEWGIWVAGAVCATATPEQIEALRQSTLSGDWRDIGGNLEAVAFHAVNTPGFPVPRARAVVASGGKCFALVASAPPKATPAGATVTVEAVAKRVAEIVREGLRPPVVASGADVRAQLAADGVDWPTISVTYQGAEYGPFEVAEGCVSAMLAAGPRPVAVDAPPVDVPVFTADSAAARLRLIGLKARGVSDGV